MRKFVLISTFLFGVVSIAYYAMISSSKSSVVKSFEIETPEIDDLDLPEHEEIADVEESVSSDVSASSRAPASVKTKSVGISSDMSFEREAEQAVAMGIISKSEVAAYIEEHKIAAQQDEQRREDEMSFSLDEELVEEKQF